jgi:predicted HTH domain antitoxin
MRVGGKNGYGYQAFAMKSWSSGMAARLAGMERVSFLLDLPHYGVTMIDLDEAELQFDMENA